MQCKMQGAWCVALISMITSGSSMPISSPALLYSRYMTWPTATSPMFLTHHTPVHATLISYTPFHHHSHPHFSTVVSPGPLLHTVSPYGSVMVNPHHHQPFWSFHTHARPHWSPASFGSNQDVGVYYTPSHLPGTFSVGHTTGVTSMIGATGSSPWNVPTLRPEKRPQAVITSNPKIDTSSQFFSRTLLKNFGGARERGQIDPNASHGVDEDGGSTPAPSANPMRASVFLQNQTMMTDNVLTAEVSTQDEDGVTTTARLAGNVINGGQTPIRGLHEGVPVVFSQSQDQQETAPGHGYSYTTRHGTGTSHTSVRFS